MTRGRFTGQYRSKFNEDLGKLEVNPVPETERYRNLHGFMEKKRPPQDGEGRGTQGEYRFCIPDLGERDSNIDKRLNGVRRDLLHSFPC